MPFCGATGSGALGAAAGLGAAGLGAVALGEATLGASGLGDAALGEPFVAGVLGTTALAFALGGFAISAGVRSCDALEPSLSGALGPALTAAAVCPPCTTLYAAKAPPPKIKSPAPIAAAASGALLRFGICRPVCDQLAPVESAPGFPGRANPGLEAWKAG